MLFQGEDVTCSNNTWKEYHTWKMHEKVFNKYNFTSTPKKWRPNAGGSHEAGSIY